MKLHYSQRPDPRWDAIDKDRTLSCEERQSRFQQLRETWAAEKNAEREERIQQKAKDHVDLREAIRYLQTDKPTISSPISEDETRALLTLSPVTTDWLVDGLLPLSGIATVFGNAGAGISRFLYDLGYHVALGRPWHGFPVRQGKVLIFTDSTPDAITRIMDSIAAEAGEPDWRSVDAFKIVDGLPEMIGHAVVFARSGKQYYIQHWCDAFDPVMVGIDPLSAIKRTTKDKENEDLLYPLAPSKGALLVTHRCTGRDDGQGKSLHRLSHAVVQREIVVEKDRLSIHRGASSVALTVLPPDARRLLELIPASGPIRRNQLRTDYNRDSAAFNDAEAVLLEVGSIELLPGYPPMVQRIPLLLPAPEGTTR